MKNTKRTEEENNCFILAFFNGTKTSIAEIHQIDMDGWQLYECFLQGEKVHYFGWDDNAQHLEWINIAEEESDEIISLLQDELVKYRKLVA